MDANDINSLKKILLIGCYMGPLPGYFRLWLKSCEYNPTIDWLIFTDQKIIDLPGNVKIINATLSQLKEVFSEKLGFPVPLERPYKLCDYKPAYGLIFSKYVEPYDFWGHCDFDMIFGDIRHFITPDILSDYDRIFNLGHLSLFRNNEFINQAFMLDGGTENYKVVYSAEQNFGFDEYNGINIIFRNNHIKTYETRSIADISYKYKRFKLVPADINYPNQIFFWERGSVYRYSFFDNREHLDNFIYIHFQKRPNMAMNDCKEPCEAFYIGSKGFFSKIAGREDKNKFMTVNPYPGRLIEFLELSDFFVKDKRKSISKRFSHWMTILAGD
jgi:hypothetical protein